jgi:hypothetical protein
MIADFAVISACHPLDQHVRGRGPPFIPLTP